MDLGEVWVTVECCHGGDIAGNKESCLLVFCWKQTYVTVMHGSTIFCIRGTCLTCATEYSFVLPSEFLTNWLKSITGPLFLLPPYLFLYFYFYKSIIESDLNWIWMWTFLNKISKKTIKLLGGFYRYLSWNHSTSISEKCIRRIPS